MKHNLRLSYFLIPLFFIILSCDYFKEWERDRKRSEEKDRIETCKESIPHTSLNELEYFPYSLTKQMFAEQNKGEIIGANLFIEDIFKIEGKTYLLATSMGGRFFLNINDSKLIKSIIEEAPFTFYWYYFFTIDETQLLNKYNLGISDEYIEDNQLIDYRVYSENDIQVLFKGTLISICN